MFKCSVSVSPYSIARFLNFCSQKQTNSKVCPIGICDERDELVAVFKEYNIPLKSIIKFITGNTTFIYKQICHIQANTYDK